MRARSKWLGVISMGVGLSALSLTSPVKSADHRDAPATTADPASDINDVYTFVDGGKFVMIMTVSPFAATGAKFADTTKYTFHTSSGAAFGTTTKDVDFTCTFNAAQTIQCWAGNGSGGTADYVTGDANKEAGITSASGKMKVFAGIRQDPFFFNLQGFKDAVTAVEGATGLTPDGAGCPNVNAATSTVLTDKLKETTSTAVPAKTEADDFKTANGLAIALSVDMSLVNAGGGFVTVWASTNK